MISILFGIYRIAVHAVVLPFFPVGQLKRMNNFLLNRSDTTRVFASNDSRQGFRQLQMLFFGQLAVLNHIHCDVRIHKAQNIQI